MIRLFAHARYDFIGLRRWAYGLSALLILPGLVLLLVRGLNYSIEFTGGTLVQLETAHPLSTAQLRAALEGVGIVGAEIQTFGADTAYVIRARFGKEAGDASTQSVTEAVGRALDATVGEAYRVVRTEAASPRSEEHTSELQSQ